MIALTLAEIARITGGTVHGDAGAADLVVDGAAYVDNRSPVERGLFVAIVGERVDGHAYAAGAHAVLGSRPTDGADRRRRRPDRGPGPPGARRGRPSRRDRAGPDRLAGQDLHQGPPRPRAGHRGPHGGDVRQQQQRARRAADGAARATPTTEHLVVEMGARGIGHIAYLCDLAPPSIAAVLNVGTAHIGEFGGRDGDRGRQGRDRRGAAGRRHRGPQRRRPARRRHGAPHHGPGADLRRARATSPGAGVRLDDLGRPAFDLGYDGTWVPVALRQTGAHQVGNAAAAAAMALAAGMGLDEVARRARRGRGGLAVADGAHRACRRAAGAQRRLQRQPGLDAGGDRRRWPGSVPVAAAAPSRCWGR